MGSVKVKEKERPKMKYVEHNFPTHCLSPYLSELLIICKSEPKQLREIEKVCARAAHQVLILFELRSASYVHLLGLISWKELESTRRSELWAGDFVQFNDEMSRILVFMFHPFLN
jgi:predicted transcriptional regulator